MEHVPIPPPPVTIASRDDARGSQHSLIQSVRFSNFPQRRANDAQSPTVVVPACLLASKAIKPEGFSFLLPARRRFSTKIPCGVDDSLRPLLQQG